MVAPATTIIYSLLDRVAPRGTATEATTWMILGYAVGGAIGAALAGDRVQASGVELGYPGLQRGRAALGACGPQPPHALKAR